MKPPENNADRMWDEYMQGKPINPFCDLERVILKDGVPIGCVQVYSLWGNIQVSSIRVFTPRQGHGTFILKEILDLADKWKVRVRLCPEPFGQRFCPRKPLVKWYKKHGFVRIYHSDDFERKPNVFAVTKGSVHDQGTTH
jgi:hypothetical protein